MSEHRIYSVTSLGRPVEPKYPTNKAILLLMPMAALTAGVLTFMQGAGIRESSTGALVASLTVFGCWALGRELAPDDDPAAFIGVALSLTAWWWWPSPSLLLLFVAVALARVVNRSTGLTARLGDSMIVTALVIWAMVSLQRPLVGLVAALAFVLDAHMADPNRRQWLFAILCVASVVVQTSFVESPKLALTFRMSPQYVIAAVTLVAFLAVSFGLRGVSSLGDIGGLALDPARIRGGMLVVWLLALQTGLQSPSALEAAMPVLAAMAGVVLGSLASRARHDPPREQDLPLQDVRTP